MWQNLCENCVRISEASSAPYVIKLNFRIWDTEKPQVDIEKPMHPKQL